MTCAARHPITGVECERRDPHGPLDEHFTIGGLHSDDKQHWQPSQVAVVVHADDCASRVSWVNRCTCGAAA